MVRVLFEQNQTEENCDLMTFRVWRAKGSVQDLSAGGVACLLVAPDGVSDGVEGAEGGTRG